MGPANNSNSWWWCTGQVPTDGWLSACIANSWANAQRGVCGGKAHPWAWGISWAEAHLPLDLDSKSTTNSSSRSKRCTQQQWQVIHGRHTARHNPMIPVGCLCQTSLKQEGLCGLDKQASFLAPLLCLPAASEEVCSEQLNGAVL